MMLGRRGRIAGYIAYYGFARHLPVSYRPYALGARRLRYISARACLQACGENVNIERGADFGSGRGVSIGSNSGLGIDCFVEGEVAIGVNVMMGPRVRIYTRNHKMEAGRPMIEQGFTEPSPVRIGDDVWIGGDVIILPGRSIGSGAVIGAGSVVSRDVAPGAIVCGNPARVVGSRQ